MAMFLAAQHMGEYVRVRVFEKFLLKINNGSTVAKLDRALYPNEIQQFNQALRRTTQLTTLHFGYFDWGSSFVNNIPQSQDVHDLSNTLRDHKTLTTLHLQYGNYFETQDFDFFANALKDNKTLTTVELSFRCEPTTNSVCPLKDATLTLSAIHSLASIVKHNKTLKTLVISDLKMDSTGFEILAKAFEYNNTITTLKLVRTKFSKDVQYFLKMLEINQTITVFNIIDCDIDRKNHAKIKALVERNSPQSKAQECALVSSVNHQVFKPPTVNLIFGYLGINQNPFNEGTQEPIYQHQTTVKKPEDLRQEHKEEEIDEVRFHFD